MFDACRAKTVISRVHRPGALLKAPLRTSITFLVVRARPSGMCTLTEPHNRESMIALRLVQCLGRFFFERDDRISLRKASRIGDVSSRRYRQLNSISRNCDDLSGR